MAFKISLNKSLIPFTRVFTDVWDPFSTPSASGHKYFVSFIDDCPRASWVYLLKSKNDVLHVILQFPKMIATQFNTPVKVFHFDNDHELYKLDYFNKLYKEEHKMLLSYPLQAPLLLLMILPHH